MSRRSHQVGIGLAVLSLVAALAALTSGAAHGAVRVRAVKPATGLPKIESLTVLHEPDAYQLRGVSCVNASHCVAVGYGAGPSVDGGVVVPITNGTLGKPIISTDASSYYNAVSCVSVSTCLIVGAAAPTASSEVEADAWILHGRTMREVPEIVVPTTNVTSQLQGVDCPTSTTCDAAGSATNHTAKLGDQPTAEFAGISIKGLGSLQAVDNDTLGYAAGVTCPSVRLCFVAGASAAGSGVLAEVDNKTGTISGFPQPSVSGLQGVACEGVGACEAAEVQDLPTYGQYQGWLEHLNASSSGTPHTVSGSQQMYDVATVNSAYYLAVGYDDSISWTTVLVSAAGRAQPPRAFDDSGYLMSISCPVQTECVATGFSQDSAADQPGGRSGVDGGVAIIHLKTAPSAPKVRILTRRRTALKARVTAPSNAGGSAIIRYRLDVTRCKPHRSGCHLEGVKSLRLSPHALTVTVHGLKPKTTYFLAATATNVIGTGPASSLVRKRTA